MFDCFMKYQTTMEQTFRRLQRTYGFHIVDGTRSTEAVNQELRKKIGAILAGKLALTKT
jgi:thymidylate kinase